jgi:hypothetical protein
VAAVPRSRRSRDEESAALRADAEARSTAAGIAGGWDKCRSSIPIDKKARDDATNDDGGQEQKV